MKSKINSMKWFSHWYKLQIEQMNALEKQRDELLFKGYSPVGFCMTQKERAVREYRENLDNQIRKLSAMEDAEVEHWCRLHIPEPNEAAE